MKIGKALRSVGPVLSTIFKMSHLKLSQEGWAQLILIHLGHPEISSTVVSHTHPDALWPAWVSHDSQTKHHGVGEGKTGKVSPGPPTGTVETTQDTNPKTEQMEASWPLVPLPSETCKPAKPVSQLGTVLSGRCRLRGLLRRAAGQGAADTCQG